MNCDFLIETKLKNEAPDLHRVFTSNVLCCQRMLNKYKCLFPTYTDHTALHSIEVIGFCNELIAENIDRLNTDEIFVLLMASYLHDSGMGINEKDLKQFCTEIPDVAKYLEKNPNFSASAIVRGFHHEFSGCFIKKYAPLFDIPSDEHLYAIIQTSRGHRKTDLFDEKEYPTELHLDNGNVIHIPYLSALIRLADELDIAADRNLTFLYDINMLTNQLENIEFKKHVAIKSVQFEDDHFLMKIHPEEQVVRDKLDLEIGKLSDTLKYCVKVIEKRTPFTIRQNWIKVEEI